MNAARSGRKPVGENFRVSGPPRASGPPWQSQVPPVGPPPPGPGPPPPPQIPQIPSSTTGDPVAGQQCPPAQAGHTMVHELAEALSHMMMMRRCGPQLHTTPRQWYY